MKLPKVLAILLILLLAVAGGFWYLKRQLTGKLTPAAALRMSQKETSPIDLRPAVIEKIKRLVWDGSDSLYRLDIDALETDIASGTITLKALRLTPDSSAIRRLDAAQKLPDDIVEMTVAELRISGIGLADILNRRDIHLSGIVCDAPRITVRHQLRPYNAKERADTSRKSLYARLSRQMDRLAIDRVQVTRGDVTDISGAQKRHYTGISLDLQQILIDSVAERDKSRLLFAKNAALQVGRIKMPVGNGSYDLGIEAVSIDGGAKSLTVRNLSLMPHGGRETFLRGQKMQTDLYEIQAPELTLSGANWWAMAHGESLIAKEAKVKGAHITLFVDQRLPAGGKVKRDNFPQQMLADAGMKVSLPRVKLEDVSITYEEFTQASNKQSHVSFSSINAVIEGATNLTAEVAAHPVATMRGSCRFMNAGTMQADLRLALPRAKRGAFKADLTVGSLASAVVNPFAEAMGLVRFTSGQLQGAKVHAEGNNDNVHGTIAAQYSDLHLEPLKSEKDKDGKLKSRRIIAVLFNGLLVKNNNPAKGGTLRQPDFSLDRTTEPNFFCFLWLGMRQGLMKSIGVPPRLGN